MRLTIDTVKVYTELIHFGFVLVSYINGIFSEISVEGRPTRIFATREVGGNTFGCVCVCVCVCPVRALSFESLDLEILFLVRRYTFRRPS